MYNYVIACGKNGWSIAYMCAANQCWMYVIRYAPTKEYALESWLDKGYSLKQIANLKEGELV